MKNYSKTGGRKGIPGYRTPVHFRSRKNLKNVKMKTYGERNRKRR